MLHPAIKWIHALLKPRRLEYVHRGKVIGLAISFDHTVHIHADHAIAAIMTLLNLILYPGPKVCFCANKNNSYRRVL